MAENQHVRFGVFEADFKAGQLQRSGARVHIQEQPFHLLQMLLEHPGEIVTREEIQQALWPGEEFRDFDHAINVAVKKLRDALGDDADNPIFVETMARRGYRFIAPLDGNGTVSLPTTTSSAWLRGIAVTAAMVAVGLAVVGYLYVRDKKTVVSRPPIASVAVLPFANLSPDKEQDYFSDGLAEELLNTLARIPALRVTARTSSFQFKGKSAELGTIRQKLKVQAIVEGSVRREGNHVHIAVQLVDVNDGFCLWSQSYDRTMTDVIAVQEEIARSVAGTLRFSLLGTPVHASSPWAYNAYLQGQYFLQHTSEENLIKAISYYDEAIRLDQGFPAPVVSRGLAYLTLGLQYAALPLQEFSQKARADAERALQLDPSSAGAHALLGDVKSSIDWDWLGARSEYRRALELEPGNAYIMLRSSRLFMTDCDASVAIANRAVEIDPVSARAYSHLVSRCLGCMRIDEALAAEKKVLEFNPDGPWVRFRFGEILLAQSRPHEALAAMEAEKSPAAHLLGLALAYHALGQKEKSDAALAEAVTKYKKPWAYQIAEVYAFRGDVDRAFEWLEIAYRQRDPGMGAVFFDFLLRNLHRDPRWTTLKKRMNFPN